MYVASHFILIMKASTRNTSVLILLPTKELCFQTLNHLKLLCHYCNDIVSYVALVGEDHGITQKYVTSSLYCDPNV